MFEIFLFINPIGLYCYDIESKVQETSDQLGIDSCYHFIPIANVGIVQDDMLRRRCLAQKLGNFSFYSLTTNRALEDYHAIKIAYGNKKARKFLFTLQQSLSVGTGKYSLDLPQEIMLKLGLNLERINALRNSDYVKDSIQQDRELAEQWHIAQTPTTIIFNENDENDSGVLLEGKISEEQLVNIFRPNHKEVATETSFQDLLSANHLRLI